MATEIQNYEQQANFLAIRPEVEDAMEVFKAGLNIKDATKAEYRALAHLCLAHNLDPFNGEAWIIPGHGTMVGIKGLRKAADNDLPTGCFYNPAVRLIQPGEFAAYALKEEKPPKTKRNGKWVENPIKLAAICELTRSDATQQWVEQLTKLTDVIGDYNEALQTLGPKPIWIGVGIVRVHDRSKMELTQLAFKRAEADATKRAFNLKFAVDVERRDVDTGDFVAVDDNAEIVDGEAVETPALPDETDDTLIQDIRGQELYDFKKTLLAELRKREPKMVVKHMENRINKRFGVSNITEIVDVTVTEFVRVMLVTSEEWKAAEEEAANEYDEAAR